MSTTAAPGQPSAASATTSSSPQCTSGQRVTRALLGYGVIAGPFYVGVSLAQAAVRNGFDLTRHEWSLLANGPGGWVQILNLILTGLMVVAAAIGYRRAQGGRWAPRLLGVYGVCLVAAGIFTADPMAGFPVGTPDGPPVAPSLHSTLHIVFGGIGFLALIAATMVLARRFHRAGHRRQAAFSVATGVLFLAGFAGIASGATTPALNLAFTAAVILAWVWLSTTSVHYYRHES
jgi:hypothetical membrane protein